jgi:hypothetical protein
MIGATYATRYMLHDSIRGGMMGMMLPIYFAIPGLPVALVVSAVASRALARGARLLALVAAILLACGELTLLRTDGVTGEGIAQLAWRWTPTAEERLLARGPVETREAVPGGGELPRPAPPATIQQPPANVGASPPTSAAAATTPEDRRVVEPGEKPLASVSGTATKPSPAGTAPGRASSDHGFTRVEWPGFRGPGRDSVIRGVRLETDWSKSPPVALWRRPIGPGWSSFAAGGGLLYTQEQRGDDEVVACYDVTTGTPVWVHRDAVRFYESNGGAGPRATPTLGNGRLYTLGATGILNALDARTGAVRWSRNAVTDAGVSVPGWGIAGSPLLLEDIVVVAASGALLAYDRATGDRRWLVESTGGSYSSPQLVTIGGTAQILLMSGAGATSVAAADGTVLWRHAWPGSPIVQPALTHDGDVLITTADAMGGLGMRRLAVARGAHDPSAAGGWTVEERWTSRGLKPYFNDFVVHKGHAFGFDGSILASIDLADGQRKWKGGRYGHGQLVLFSDQDLLLLLSEEGELALVNATADKFTQIARFPAIEGKTWNHPVVVGDILLVRNGQEMAAFRLPGGAR